MIQVFADAFYYIALLSKSDQYHSRVLTYLQDKRFRVVTTDWVLVELADGLASSQFRNLVIPLINEIVEDTTARLIKADDRLLQAGLELYAKRTDKHWSLTDCISFVVMKNENIAHALTADHHFEQAGFVALLK